MDDKGILMDALKFHGHKCWASVAGVRVGLAALRVEEQLELVDLVWDAPEADILTIGEVISYKGEWFPEIMGFTQCAACGELTAHAYLRVVGNKHVCIPCSGY